MKYPKTYILLMLFFVLVLPPGFSQITQINENDKQKVQELYYQNLKNQGLSDLAIYEDLGNVNFLSKNFETAIYWYHKFLSDKSTYKLKADIFNRYQFSIDRVRGTSIEKSSYHTLAENIRTSYSSVQNYSTDIISNSANKAIISDLDQSFSMADIALKYQQSKLNLPKAFFKIENHAQLYAERDLTITNNGNTVYFSKPNWVKPVKGIFSKKQLVYRIYKTDKLTTGWSQPIALAIGDTHSSNKNPTVSPNGKRLFFASNMPGSFGKFDIYVTELNSNGLPGIAKNLGKKVNTSKNEIHPKMVNNYILLFSSEGKDGYGSLDIFQTKVRSNTVDLAINLGAEINSNNDEFVVYTTWVNNSNYVLTNRTNHKSRLNQMVFSIDIENKIKPYEFMAKKGTNSFEKTHKTEIAESLFDDDN